MSCSGRAGRLICSSRIVPTRRERVKIHHLVGHRWFLEPGSCQQPDPTGELPVTTAKPFFRCGAIGAADGFAIPSYTITGDTTHNCPASGVSFAGSFTEFRSPGSATGLACFGALRRLRALFSSMKAMSLPRRHEYRGSCRLVTKLPYLDGFRSRTPAPPPFSSMNSTPAALNAFSISTRVFGSPTYRPTSILLIVFR